MKRQPNHKTKIFALATAGVLATVGIAFAAIPGADGVIHGCYDASSPTKGQLRVIDAEAGTRCAKNETALNFNQKGPKGDKGDKGDACLSSDPACVGAKGDTGATGPAGPVFGTVRMTTNGAEAPTARSTPTNPPFTTFDFTLPSAGPTYLQFHAATTYSAECGSGYPLVAAYVDNTPVAHMSTGSLGYPMSLVGITSLTAGAHTASLHVMCSSGSLSNFVHSDDGAWTVLLLGSA